MSLMQMKDYIYIVNNDDKVSYEIFYIFIFPRVHNVA